MRQINARMKRRLEGNALLINKSAFIPIRDRSLRVNVNGQLVRPIELHLGSGHPRQRLNSGSHFINVTQRILHR